MYDRIGQEVAFDGMEGQEVVSDRMEGSRKSRLIVRNDRN